MLEINKLCVRYGGKTVLGDLSLALQAGRIHALIGPSGCGKSTLLKVLCGIQPVSGGAVLYNGAALYGCASLTGGPATQNAPNSPLPRIGYVPQNYGLLDWKTVEQNIFLPLHIGNTRLEGRELSEAQNAAGEIIETLGLREVLGRYPRELSGGQQQRAALARAFILRPDLLLMDEPFSALDAFTSASSRALFLDLWRKHKVTTLLITHNMHEAAELGQTILLMAPGGTLTTLEPDASLDPDRQHLVARMSELLREVTLP